MPQVWQVYGMRMPGSAEVEVPGNNVGRLLNTLAIQRLPTEPIGTYTLTLQNLVIGSAIRIETQAGALIEFRTATGATEVFSIPTFGGSEPADQLRIKVRKGTAAPYYIPYETQATAFVGSASIFVSQIPDE